MATRAVPVGEPATPFCDVAVGRATFVGVAGATGISVATGVSAGDSVGSEAEAATAKATGAPSVPSVVEHPITSVINRTKPEPMSGMMVRLDIFQSPIRFIGTGADN